MTNTAAINERQRRTVRINAEALDARARKPIKGGDIMGDNSIRGERTPSPSLYGLDSPPSSPSLPSSDSSSSLLLSS